MPMPMPMPMPIGLDGTIESGRYSHFLRDAVKILLFNFVQPDEPGRPGGGVSVYLDSLMRCMHDSGDEVVLLSSGDRYSTIRRAPFLKVIRGTPTRAYIYNSPQIAPARLTFHHPHFYVSDPSLNALPRTIRRELGHFDVLHFHNIEGLTTGFFRALRAAYPNSKLILSAHNYNLVCPQVNLWRRESAHCEDFDGGRACLDCVPSRDRRKNAITIKRLQSPLKHFTHCGGGEYLNSLYKLARKSFVLAGEPGLRDRPSQVTASIAPPEPYAAFRRANVALSNEVFDAILAVSKRTKAVLAQNGVPPNKIRVSYIGSSHHALIDRSPRREDFADGLHIAYLGYMRKDKGFDFLIECLERMGAEDAGNLTVTIAARFRDDETVSRVRQLAPKFRRLLLLDGYSRDTMDELLSGVHLGIVPPMWEDNLPQVAIELVCRGIPILTSDRGGACELADRPSFVFRAGDHGHLIDRILAISRRDVPLSDFWQGELCVRSMERHVEELREIYQAIKAPTVITTDYSAPPVLF